MGVGAAPPSLIHTKLNRPRIATALVERPRLYAMLDSQRPLTVVAAPAGYGKTTLISDWVQRCGLPYVWLSLDAGASQPGVFVNYLLAAIERTLPAVAQGLVLASAGSAVSYATMARNLADALDKVPESFVVVLDDYHVIAEPTIHLFLAELLRYPPRSLNMVIASRVDPPLPLAVMRARDQVTEIRARDLRFTSDETADYMARELDETPGSDTVASLTESTEGWIAGLHLATILLRNQDTASAAALLQGHSRFAIDYLASEVLAQQTPEVQSFLLQTSILQRMCPALCDAILGASQAPQQSRRILEHLELANVFLLSLDDSQQWFRYHHLFRQLLVQMLHTNFAPAEIAALYAAASRWCCDHDLVDEAVTYALAAGDAAQATMLIEQNRHTAMNEEKWQQLEQWLCLVPRRTIDESPQLLILEAWILHKHQRVAEIPERLDLAEALLDADELPPETQVDLRGEIDALRSQSYFVLADATRSYQWARRALDHVSPAKASVRGVAWLFAAGSLFLSAGLQPALDALVPASAEDRAQRTAVAGRVLLVKCFLYWMAADLLNLKETAEELLRLATQRNWQDSVIWAHYFRGAALYELNDLAAAADDFLVVLNQRHSAPGYAFVEGAFGLACIRQAQNDPDSAMATAAMLLDYAQQMGDLRMQHTTLTFQAYLNTGQGNLDAAFAWIAGANRSIQVSPLPGFFEPAVAMAVVLVRLGSPACLTEAEQILSKLEPFLASTHNDRYLIDVLILKALLCAARRQQSEALAALGQAVTLAQRGGVLRVFLDADAALDPLLDRLRLSGSQAAFVQQVRSERAHFHGPARKAHAAAPTRTDGMALVQPRHPDLIELLTQREAQILQLLALRLTNKEIAQALDISTGTVKQHTRNVFRKLHADNRRDAIVQAQNMGFHFDVL